MNTVKQISAALIKALVACLLTVGLCAFSVDLFPIIEAQDMTDALPPEQIQLILRSMILFILPIPLFALGQAYDPYKKRSVFMSFQNQMNFGQSLLSTLASPFFWLDDLFLLIPLSAMSYSDCIVDLLFQGAETSSLTLFGLKLLVLAFPLTVIFLFIESILRQSWYRDWEFTSRTKKDAILEAAANERLAVGRLLLNLLFISVGTWLLPPAAEGFVGAASILTVFSSHSVIILIVAVIVAYWLLRGLKADLRRRKFIKKLCKICTYRGFDMESHLKPFRGLFFCSQNEDFTLITPEKRYAGSILPIPHKSDILYFDLEGKGYRFLRKFRSTPIFFPRHRLKLIALGASPCDKPTERIVIVTPEPKNMGVGDQVTAYQIYNGAYSGADSGDFTVYIGDAFCNMLDRQSI